MNAAISVAVCLELLLPLLAISSSVVAANLYYPTTKPEHQLSTKRLLVWSAPTPTPFPVTHHARVKRSQGDDPSWMLKVNKLSQQLKNKMIHLALEGDSETFMQTIRKAGAVLLDIRRKNNCIITNGSDEHQGAKVAKGDQHVVSDVCEQTGNVVRFYLELLAKRKMREQQQQRREKCLRLFSSKPICSQMSVFYVWARMIAKDIIDGKLD